MDWVKRINSVLDYVEDNLDGDIDDKTIASIFVSPQGVFQRMFANITNMTLAEYIRKRRLTQAAFDLNKTDIKIIDIAIKYGYNSAVAFSSAFKNFHGMTPSNARKSGNHLQSFKRLSFTLILSEKGVDSMQYHNIENAEFIMSQTVNQYHKKQYLRTISDHNGIKCACDGYRAFVILPDTVKDWDMTDAYFDTNEINNPKFELNQVFNNRDDGSLHFSLSKEQAALLLVSLDGLKTDFKRKFVSLTTSDNDSASQEAIVCIELNSLGIITEASSAELKGESNKAIMNFNVKLIEEALKFVMCSYGRSIDIYYNGNLKPLIIKSGCLYAMVMPVKLKND